MFDKLNVLHSHGIQYIKELRTVILPETFRGRPEIKPGLNSSIAQELEAMCPSSAIETSPLSIDLGKCIFCGECQLRCPGYIKFSNDYRIATTSREDLIVKEGEYSPIRLDNTKIRPEIKKLFSKALKFRQVSAGGDNSAEMELNASSNVNFDFGRYGVEFVASPRHSDGVLITGPITENMSAPLELCYNAIPSPKIVVLVGSDAISGGLYANSGAIDRSFLERHQADLYIPGNPPHPLTFIHGCMDLIDK